MKLINKSGRNNNGHKVIKSKGKLYNKRVYKKIDFKRDLSVFKVNNILYDSNRTSYIASDNKNNYILAPKGIEKGDILFAKNSNVKNLKIGDNNYLKNIKLGTVIHNVSLYPKSKGQLARSAGTHAILLNHIGDKTIINLNKRVIFKLSNMCNASLGFVSNINHNQKKLKKAGNSRWIGRHPIVRGIAKNPTDHPHGGGGGKSKGGRYPVNSLGKLTKGFKTVKKKKCRDLLGKLSI